MYTNWKSEKEVEMRIQVSTVLNLNNNLDSSPKHVKVLFESKGDLAVALNPILIFGKLLGLISVSGKYKYRWNVVIAPFLSLIIIVELVHFFITSETRKTPLDLASSLGILLFYLAGIVVYAYLYRNLSVLENLFVQWKGLKLHENHRKDIYLYRDVNSIAFLILFSAIFENVIFHLKLCSSNFNSIDISNGTEKQQLFNTDNFLHCSYRKMYPSWNLLIPYSDVLSILLIISNKMALYAWNYIDVLIIVLSRALYFLFEDLAHERPASPSLWKFKLRSEFNELLQMLDAVEEFLSPLIFTSYTINTYSLCMQLNLWLTPSKNVHWLDSVYSIWSSLHLVLRVLLVSLAAARVHDSAGKVQKLTQLCPTQSYTLELVRLEELMATTKIGLSGLGCFIITKHFILSIISVIFTFEVVLLQSVDTSGQKCKN